MKKNAMFAAGWVLLLALWSFAGDEAPRTFQGEIGDSQCALNIHSLTRSHQEMLKSKSMGGDAAACARYCTKYLGGNFVLVVKKDVYRLDDQNRAQVFAGKRVKITGTLDAKNGTIHILQIEPK
ncbi:MAG: DUF5818 domain-containing protein [Terriglobales bacterium]